MPATASSPARSDSARPRSPDPAQVDQRVVLHGVPWDQYEALLATRGDDAGVRVTYLRGELEIMSPSIHHERIKTTIARLLETWAVERGLDLEGYGSWTVRDEAEERGAEPDECYLVGKQLSDFPEIVLEVIHTSPLLNKLEVYAGFGVAEVWLFKDGGFRLYELEPATGAYHRVERSPLLPGLDFAMIARFAIRTDTPQALREFETDLRG